MADTPTISGYELFELPPRWVFLKIETTAGIDGWGEPVIEGRSKTVIAAVEELMDTYLMGEDPLQIEHHWQTMYRGGFYRGGPILMSAIAGIDQALWDIKGKYYDTPVHQLLGGKVREKIQFYQWIGGDRPSKLSENAEELIKAEVTAMKMNATEEFRQIESPAAITAAAERVESVRETVGETVDIGIDFHGRVSKSMAPKLIAALEPYDPMFIEEPVLPEHNDELDNIAAKTNVPIATGERMFSRWEFKTVLENSAVDVIQPDPSHAGGITELKKIAAMAAAYDVALAPHCPLGPVSLAAALQIDACCPNALIQESSFGIHYNEEIDVPDYLADRSVLKPKRGYLNIPDGPGLGIEIDECAVRDAAGSVDWHNPVWRHEDGSIAEW